MKNLYFAFAVIALPIMAFAEAGDTMTDQTSQKQIDTKKGIQHNDYRCSASDPKSEGKCVDHPDASTKQKINPGTHP